MTVLFCRHRWVWKTRRVSGRQRVS